MMTDPDQLISIRIHCPSHPEFEKFPMKWCFIPGTGDTLIISGIPLRAEVVEWDHEHGLAKVVIYLVDTELPVVPDLVEGL